VDEPFKTGSSGAILAVAMCVSAQGVTPFWGVEENLQAELPSPQLGCCWHHS